MTVLPVPGQISELLKPHRVCLLAPVVLGPPSQTGHRLLVSSEGTLVEASSRLSAKACLSVNS